MEKEDERRTSRVFIPFNVVVVWSLGDEGFFLERCCMCNTKEGRGAWNCIVLVPFQWKRVEIIT